MLQGLATENTNGAIVGGLSPYANKFIKEQTGDNQTANLMAHAMLGAIEAKATGNNALAGATGAVGSEITAKLITEKLYNKPVSELTEKEKETVSTLSQIAGGLAGGAVGDSTQNGVVAAEIGERAVENNLLSNDESNKLFNISEKFDKKGGLLKQDREYINALLLKDKLINRLLKKYQENPNNLSDQEKYYLDTQLKNIASADQISVDQLYKWNFNSTINWTNPALIHYLGQMEQYEQDPITHIAKGVGDGLFLVGTPEISVVKGINATTNVIKKGINLAKKYPKLTETVITGSIDTGYDIYNGEFSPEKMTFNYIMGGVMVGKSLSQRLSIGASSTLILSGNDKDKSDKEILADVGRNTLSILGGYPFGKVLDKTKLPTPVKQTISEFSENYFENKINDVIRLNKDK